MPYKEILRQSRWLSPWKRELSWDLTAAFTCLMRDIEEKKSDFSQSCSVKGQEAADANSSKGYSYCI